MTFLAPWWLAAGAGAALALVALHLLAVGRPAPLVLPTARFVPARAARARRLATRPNDLLLLATRVAAALLAAAALARPARAPERRGVARVIVADRSRAARDAGAVRDSVRALAATGDVVIAFDTAAPPAAPLGDGAARDSALAPLGAPSAAPHGSLSAALAAARRAAPALRDAADSVELVIVSPLTTREVDAATGALRAAWSGRARVVRVAATEGAAAPTGVRVIARRGGVADDALAAAARSAGTGRVGGVPRTGSAGANVEVGGGAPQGPGTAGSEISGGSPPTSTMPSPVGAGGTTPTPGPLPVTRDARVVRDGLTPADLAWAYDSGGVLVDWPVDGAPAGWSPRPARDTAGAVASGGAVFVAPLPRRVAWRGGDSARVIARWADGEPAAVERAAGAGCVREVAVAVPQVGDAALRPPFLALLDALAAACAHRSHGAPLDDASVRALAGTGPLLATRTLAAPPPRHDPLARWLLGAALALLLVELPLRRIGARRAPDEADADGPTSATRPARETAA